MRVLLSAPANLVDNEGEKVAALTPFEQDAKPHFLLYVNGELVASVAGISMPNLEKAIKDNIPEGVLEEDAMAEEEEAAEEDA